MLGLLAAEPATVHVPLLGWTPVRGAPAVTALAERARALFRDQVEKAGLPMGVVAEASLVVSASELGSPEWLHGRRRPARELRFVARAVTDLGREYERARSERVAPHDPAVETQSARAPRPGGE